MNIFVEGGGKTTISELHLTSNIDEILKVGNEVKPLTITVDDPKFQGKINVEFYSWWKKTGPGATKLYNEKNFEEGEYYFVIKVSINDAYK